MNLVKKSEDVDVVGDDAPFPRLVSSTLAFELEGLCAADEGLFSGGRDDGIGELAALVGDTLAGTGACAGLADEDPAGCKVPYLVDVAVKLETCTSTPGGLCSVPLQLSQPAMRAEKPCPSEASAAPYETTEEEQAA